MKRYRIIMRVHAHNRLNMRGDVFVCADRSCYAAVPGHDVDQQILCDMMKIDQTLPKIPLTLRH